MNPDFDVVTDRTEAHDFGPSRPRPIVQVGLGGYAVADFVLTMWAIRRRADDAYLPNIPSGHRQGYSFLEPVQFAGQQPRLFRTQRAAKGALTMWLKGHLVKKWGPDSGDPFGSDGQEEELEWKPVAGRNARDMEVVPVKLILPTPSVRR